MRCSSIQTSFGTPKSADIGWMKLTQVVMEEPHGMDNETSKIPECMPTVNSYNRTNHLFYNSPEIGTNLRSEIGTNQTTHHATEGQIGFATAGSGTAISVSDEHLAKATKLLADDNNSLVDRAMTCDNSDGDSPTPTGNDSASSCTDDKTKETTTIDMPRPSLGFASAGSGSLIFVSDENLSKAAKLLADGNDDSLIDRTMTSDYDDGGTTLSTSIGISTSYTDATTTANNSCIAPRTALGFASAGNGSLIQVSEESLSRATMLLVDSNDRAVDSTSRIGYSKKYHISSVETSSSSNSFGFAPAGSGAFIRVSDEELSRASKLLAVKTIDEPTSNVDSYRSSSGTEKICTTSFEAPRSHHGFASAGSGALIQISNESLIRASALLADSNDCLVERVMTCDDDHDDTSATCNDGRHSSRTDSLFYPTAFDAPCVSLGFSSAGSGALILVSDESLSRASKLLADSTERTISNTDTDEHETRTPCIGNRRSIHPPIADTNTKSPFSSMATHSNIGFASAGSGAVITVSDESLLRASSLLADTNDCFEQQAMTIDETQRASNEENMTFRGPEKNYLQSLELSGAPLGFTCAGSGSLIKISDESLSRASTLLADSDDCLVTREMTLNGKHDDTNDDGYPTRADTMTLPTSSSDASWTSFGFASAGSGSLIRISDESLSRASKLLEERDDCLTGPALSCDDEHTNYCPSSTATIDIPSISVGFTSAGSGSLIFASDESLTKASKLLAENDGEDYQVMFDAEHDSTNFRTSEDGSTCIETTHLDRNLSENKNRRHGNQKVRFSLDTSQSTYRQQPTVTPSIYNSDHATDAKTQCAGPTVLLCNSRKTPDHRHVDEDTAFGSRNCNGYARQNDTDYKSHTPCHSESNHRANIVTDRKDTPASAIQSSLEDMHTSPHGNSTRTPLFEMTNIVGDPLQSVMKSKRLFQATGSEGNEHRSNVDKSKMLDVALNGVSTLRQFAVNHHATETNSWAECTEYGVKDATMQVNSVNAIKLRFSLDDDSPLFFLGQRNPPKGNHVGKIADIRAWLCSQECDKSLISDKWIQNHVRWIVWKLAAMERRFPVQLGGQYLTYSHVLSQMKGRYEKELRFAKRPALRKVLNRDVSASMPIILCVSQILRFQPKKHVDGGNGSVGQNNSEEVRLELSDGWYAVSAILDCVLTTMIEGGKIRVGSKLMICNAQLVGTDDGVDPLDDDFSSDRRNCPIFLKITANNSRLAKWDAMLGFVHPKYTANQGGGILTKSLSDIFPDGGNIPAVDVVICKRYPRMFLEQVKDVAGQTIATNHLTEAEEAARENDHDMIHQRTSEHYAEHACKECSEVRMVV